MKRVNFENGKITQNILGVAMPMLVAQLISLLYNVIDRIYIARIPDVGTAALGGVGLCFPITIIITAFSNLFGSGGSPLFSIRRGMGDDKTADTIMNTAFTMLCGAAIILMAVGMIFARPLLVLFGASESALTYAYPYMMIYLLIRRAGSVSRCSRPCRPALLRAGTAPGRRCVRVPGCRSRSRIPCLQKAGLRPQR